MSTWQSGAWRVDVAFDPFSQGTLEQLPNH
jgi:hypothetical protein